MITNLQTRTTKGAAVTTLGEMHWRLEIPAGPGGQYRWAQLDDYMHLPRGCFLHVAPQRINLRARVSAADLAGTWGFGLWNDPFAASLGIGGTRARLPVLPNTAWFFYASAPNYLAFRDDHPAQGFLAATFAASRIAGAFLAPGLLAAPLMFWPPGARLLRRAASRIIREAAKLLTQDVTLWHEYSLDWSADCCRFYVDGDLCLETPVSPGGRLGWVMWIDNQYAAFGADGKVGMGTLATAQDAWLEIEIKKSNYSV
jgi:hypothetical protein